MMYSFCRFGKIHTCHYRQVFFLFLLFLAAHAMAVPGVGIRMTKTGADCHITVYGVSIGTFKEAKIICEYGSSVEIDKSLIGSPVSNISIGASIDRDKKQLTIYMSATGNVNIDSASMGVIQFPLNGVPDNSTFKLLEATFKNSQGEALNAVILPATSVFKKYANHKSENKGYHDHIMLNGRCIKLQTLNGLEKKAHGNFIPVRIIKR